MAGEQGVRNTVIGLVMFISLIVGLFVLKQMAGPPISLEDLRKQGVYVYEPPRLLKPFTLQNQVGNDWTKSELEEHWTLVFFGFASCPDVCPATMAMLNQAMNRIEAAGRNDTQVIMITVDPARDTVEVLKQYVPYFNPDFIGLTGDFLQILSLANNMNAGFQKIVGENGNYTVDHSAYIYLLNPYGDIHGFFKPPFDADSFSKKYLKVREYIKL